MDKTAVRSLFRLRRKGVSNRIERARSAMDKLTSLPLWKNAKTVLLYHSVGSEIETTELISRAQSEKKRVLLPVTLNTTGDMGVGIIERTTSVSNGHFSIPEPQRDQNYDLSTIDLVLVPGVAFDSTGGRIGQGGGYYDRFLANLSMIKIGFCFSNQLTDEPIQCDDHDIKMNFVITDLEVIQCRG